MNAFQHALGAPGRVVSAYDTGISGYDPEPTAVLSRFEDPLLTAMTAPLTSAIVDHLARTLNWKVSDARYNLLNGSVNGQWRWGRVGASRNRSANCARRSRSTASCGCWWFTASPIS